MTEFRISMDNPLHKSIPLVYTVIQIPLSKKAIVKNDSLRDTVV